MLLRLLVFRAYVLSLVVWVAFFVRFCRSALYIKMVHLAELRIYQHRIDRYLADPESNTKNVIGTIWRVRIWVP